MEKDKVLNDIYLQIREYLDRKPVLDYSLLGQDFGCIMFLYFYSRKYNISTDIADGYLDRMLGGMLQSMTCGSYCNGLAGLGLGLRILEDESFITGVEDALDNMDGRLKESFQTMLSNYEIDFLHGCIGVGFYLLTRRNGRCEEMLYSLIDLLDAKAIRQNDRIYWEINDEEPYKHFNISFSHGAASMMLLLAKMHRHDFGNIRNDKTEKLLRGTINYILSQKLNPHEYGSFFPTFPKESGVPLRGSRLAWCYGDLGIAMALKETALILEDEELYKTAIQILEFNATRRDVKSTNVIDAELCHGASGVAFVFKTLYGETQNDIFLKAFNYWYSRVINMSKEINGRNTFPTFNNGNSSWNICYGILDGISGVGLLLLEEDKLLNKLLFLKD